MINNVNESMICFFVSLLKSLIKLLKIFIIYSKLIVISFNKKEHKVWIASFEFSTIIVSLFKISNKNWLSYPKVFSIIFKFVWTLMSLIWWSIWFK